MLKDKLKSLRESYGLTQEELSKSLNMPRSTYANYESGNREPEINILIEIAQYYGITIDHLVGRNDNNVISLVDEVREILIRNGFDLNNDSEEIQKMLRTVINLYKEIKG